VTQAVVSSARFAALVHAAELESAAVVRFDLYGMTVEEFKNHLACDDPQSAGITLSPAPPEPSGESVHVVSVEGLHSIGPRSSRPAASAFLAFPEASKRRVQFAYLTRVLPWRADYRLTLGQESGLKIHCMVVPPLSKVLAGANVRFQSGPALGAITPDAAVGPWRDQLNRLERHADERLTAEAAADPAGSQAFSATAQTSPQPTASGELSFEIAAEPVKARQVLVFDPRVHGQLAMVGLEVENPFAFAAPQGSLIVVENGVGSGRGRVADWPANAYQILPYRLTTELKVDRRSADDPSKESGFQVKTGVLHFQRIDQRSITFDLDNRSNRLREVVLREPAYEGWRVAEPVRSFESSWQGIEFRVTLLSRRTMQLPIRLTRERMVEIDLAAAPVSSLEPYATSINSPEDVAELVRAVFQARKDLEMLTTAVVDQVEKIRKQNELKKTTETTLASINNPEIRQRTELKLRKIESDLAQFEKQLTTLTGKETAAKELVAQLLQRSAGVSEGQ
jgi:hypothetical protein